MVMTLERVGGPAGTVDEWTLQELPLQPPHRYHNSKMTTRELAGYAPCDGDFFPIKIIHIPLLCKTPEGRNCVHHISSLYMGYLRARLVRYCMGSSLYESGVSTGEEASANLYNMGDAAVYWGQTGPTPIFGSRLVTKLTK